MTPQSLRQSSSLVGPGSGKSFIVGKTGLPALGLKVVNSDDAYEAAMKKAGMEMSSDNIFSVKGQEIRGRAKALTGKKQARYLMGRLGVVVDGTGKDFEKVKKQAQAMKALGYDIAMIFVNTDLDTAIARDKARDRTIGEKGSYQLLEDCTEKYRCIPDFLW